jgi:hypothetical protein
MDKTALLELLRDNLELKVEVFHTNDWYSTDLEVEVTIKFDGEIIAKDKDSVTVQVEGC